MNYKNYIHSSVFFIFFTFVIQSCRLENDTKIIGHYYIQKIGDSKTSLGCEINHNEPKFSFKKNLVNSYVYEVQWNENFILAKQHPEYEVQVEALNQIFHINRRKIMKEKGVTNENEFYFDTLLVEKVRNESEIEFEKRLENGDLEFIKTRNRSNAMENNITFYYLIDIKNNPYEPFVFFHNDSLKSYIERLKVGKFIHKRNL